MKIMKDTLDSENGSEMYILNNKALLWLSDIDYDEVALTLENAINLQKLLPKYIELLQEKALDDIINK